MEPSIENDQLIFGDDGLRVGFQRTLRIPDDGRRHPLPAGLGLFPPRRIEDYASRVPPSWRARGGIFMPLYRREAMWLRFRSPEQAPFAVKVGVGKVCALTGLPWLDALRSDVQDYLVAPPQPWLDGIYVGPDEIRQFVATPLGEGYTVEGQVTGEERHGGLQLAVHVPKVERRMRRPHGLERRYADVGSSGVVDGTRSRSRRTLSLAVGSPPARAMGLAAGGRMKQKIHPDPFGVDHWRPLPAARVFVHLVDSHAWTRITGEPAPKSPITARTYREAGLPWFTLYDEGDETLPVDPILARIKGIAELDALEDAWPDPADAPVDARPPRRLWHRLRRRPVDDGLW